MILRRFVREWRPKPPPPARHRRDPSRDATPAARPNPPLETEEELVAVGEDVFRYFGLGCRNVSKVFFPQDFDLDRLFRAFFPWKENVHHNKYANNYDYTRALWMLDRIEFVENGYLLMKEDAALASPVATLFYERYSAIEPVAERLVRESASIQCVVGHGQVPFGHAQHPALSDYADGVDTLQFLIDLK